MNEPFYVTGGTLPVDADSYLLRQADAELLEGLRRGEFCYVLNTRQMGKSSLMVRTARKLREEGWRVIVLDLTAIGQNLSVEQWYFGLLSRAAEQTDREYELLDVWKARRGTGPMQRFVGALREVLLADGKEAQKLVLFVDEIDAVRSLPFSADEFFAGIRECYNRRAYEPAFENLTFCLLGVATPGDLIRDTRISPFNIGRRIELHDFTPEEAQPLSGGLTPPGKTDAPSALQAQRLLKHVLSWTNGHPYITQRLCHAVAAKIRSDKPRGKDETDDEALVAATCHQLFLTRAARETDDNLTFVSSRLLRDETDVAGLLALYSKVRAKKRVLDNQTNPLCTALRLSGVVMVDKGQLRMRNRIYEQVFDAEWVRDNLPNAELRRQRQAYWRGIVRAAVVGGAVLLVVSGLAGVAINRAIVARQFGAQARRQEELARGRLSRLYVDAGIQAMQVGDYAASLPPLLEAMRLDKDDADRMALYRRRFAVALAELPHLDHVWFATNPLTWASVSPDGAYVAAAGEEGSVHLWNLRTHEEMPAAIHHDGPIVRAAFSPDGTRLVTCGADARARVWEVPSGRLLCTLSHPNREDKRNTVTDASWSRDGKRVATAGYSLVVVWDLSAVRPGQGISKDPNATAEIKGDNGARVVLQQVVEGAQVEGATLSPDGTRLSLVSSNYRAWMIDVPGDRTLYPIGKTGVDGCWNAYKTEFSADGRSFLIAGIFNAKGGAGLFDAATGKTIALLTHDSGKSGYSAFGPAIWYAAFGPGERQIVTAGDDRSALVWDARTGKPITPPLLHSGIVTTAAFSANGRRLVTASDDGTVSVWDIMTGKLVCAPARHPEAVVAAQFVGDDQHLLTAGRDGTARLWTIPNVNPSENRHYVMGGYSLESLSDNRILQITNLPPGATPLATAGNQPMLQSRLEVRDFPTGASVASSTNLPPFSRFRFSSDHRRIVITGRKTDGVDTLRSIQVWDTAQVRPLSPVWQADGGFLSDDGKLVLLMDKKGEWRLMDIAAGVLRLPPWRDRFEAGAIGYSTFFTSNSRGVVQAEDASTLRLRDTRTGAPVTSSLKHNAPIESVSFSPDGRYLFTMTRQGTLYAWNIAESALAAPPMPHCLPLEKGGIVFDTKKRYAITLSAPYAWLWDLTGGGSLRPHRLPLYNTRSIVMSPDGNAFVAREQQDWLWRTDTGKSITPVLEHSHKIDYAVFSPDSRFVLAIRDDGVTRVWDVQTGTPITPPLEKGQSIIQAAWSPDGRMVATADNATKSKVRVWDAKTGDALMFSQSLPEDIIQLKFSCDGSQLFAASLAGFWNWALPSTAEGIARLQAHAELLSGQTIDATTGTAPVDTATLQAAWRRLK